MTSNTRRLFPFALAFVLLPLFAREAAACSCMAQAAPCQAYWDSEAVFVGTVSGFESLNLSDGDFAIGRRLVRFAVSETLRGERAPEAEVVTGMGGGDCGYPFRKGATYVVYAHRSPTDGRLHTGICNRTRPLERAGNDLEYARGLATAPPGASIFGEVNKKNYESREGEWSSFKPVPSAELTLEGEAAGGEATRRKAESDERGNFSFKGLPPGAYVLTLKLPPGLTSDGPVDEARTVERQLKVVERGCAGTGFLLEADTRVGGRVLDAAGRPVSNVSVWLRNAPSNKAAPRNFYRPAHTDGEGRFEFARVPPGGYLLEVLVLGPRAGAGPNPEFPRTFYPDASSPEGAEVVDVKEGDRRRDLDVRLPVRLEEYVVEGFVVRDDGRPAPGAGVYLWLPGGGVPDDLIEHHADAQGRFTLKVYEGLKYKVTAVPPNVIGGSDPMSRWTDVPPSPGSPPLRLVAPTPLKD